MPGLTESLWPIRYKPFPDELLSSWLVRLAVGHGLKVQTFCNLIFGNRLQVWNRDIDRLAPSWLVETLAARTGTAPERALMTTLRPYEGVLYRRFRASGMLDWIQTLKMYHRKRAGFGLQFCAQCLAEGPEPYYRRAWRVSFCTTCSQHGRMLDDRCPACGAGVAFHRMDVGARALNQTSLLSACHACGYDLQRTPAQPVTVYDRETWQWIGQLCECVALADTEAPAMDLDELLVVRQIAGMLLSPRLHLRQHVCDSLGIADIALLAGKLPFETRDLTERHHVLQLAGWLMVDLQPRLAQAWRAKAVRYNRMLKDFEGAPQWYGRIVEGFADWRSS